MSDEALLFAEDALNVGAQSTRLRGLLQKRYNTHLLTKDVINLKQKLTGNDVNEWAKTVEVLKELDDEKEEEGGKSKNVVQVVHNDEEEVCGIYFQTELQRKVYLKYGTVVEMDGTYGVTNVGFPLYHLLCEDNNGESQPVAQYFTRSEMMEDISKFLQMFSEVGFLKYL